MQDSTKKRIQDVIGNLRSKTALEARFGPPQTLAERMNYYHTPGASIAVINNFELDWVRGFGLRDARYQDPVTARTLFQAGSISKPVFSLAVLKLVQEGILNLDEDIGNYLSSWRLTSNGGWEPRLTLRQLLSHTAGLNVHGFPGYQASETVPAVYQVLDGESPANTAPVQVNMLPGLQFRYSGGGTTVAQQLVVDQLGKPFPKIMQELILGPFGLEDSTYQQPLPRRLAARAATAHPWKGIPLRGKYHTYPEMAAAGLWTTASDLAKLGISLLKCLRDPDSSVVLSQTSIEAMVEPELGGQTVREGEKVGLGFFMQGDGDSFSFGHRGWDEGFLAFMRFYRATGQGAIIMLNSNEGHPLIEEIVHAIAVEYGWPDARQVEPEEVTLVDLDAYCGRYRQAAGPDFLVFVQGDSLVLKYADQPPLPIHPASAQEFFSVAVNTRFVFGQDENGKICSLTLLQDGNSIRTERSDGD